MIRRAFFTAVLVLALAVASASYFFSGPFTLGVLLGGGLALGNLALLWWLAKRWAAGRRKGIMVLLLAKLWVAALLLFLMVMYLSVEPAGLLVGMAVAVLALILAAAFDGRDIMRSSESSTNA